MNNVVLFTRHTLIHMLGFLEVGKKFTNDDDMLVNLPITRRNVTALLEKLDHVANGGHSHCTLIKRDTVHSKYPLTGFDEIAIKSIEGNDAQSSSFNLQVALNDDGEFLCNKLTMHTEDGQIVNVVLLEDDEYYTDRAAGDLFDL